MRIALVLWGLAFGLMGCSINQTLDREQVSGNLALKSFQDYAQIGTALTTTETAALTQKNIRVFVPSRGQSFFATKVAEHGNRSTYQSAQGQSLEFETLQLVATRGMGFDLMAAEFTDQGHLDMRFLDGNNQLQRATKKCSSQEHGHSNPLAQGRLQCSVGDLVFEERFWYDETRGLPRSKQWINAELGLIYVEWIN